MPGNENMAIMPPAHLKTPEEILGDLLNLARGNQPALNAFNVYAIDAAFEENLKTLHALPEKSLEAAAELLGASPKVAGKKRYQNRTTLAEWIIMRISALFPYECGACGEEYQVERLAKPKRRCHQCGQGSHDCQSFLDSLKTLGGTLPAGYVWLCHPCGTKDRIEAFNDYEPGEVNSDDEYLNKISPAQNKKDKRKRNAVKKGESSTTPVNTDPDQDARRSLKLNLGDSGAQEGTPPEDTVPEQPEEEENPQREKRKSDKFEKICELYKRQACPHGRKGDQLVGGKPCQKSHPPVCARYIAHGRTRKVGCAKGKDCPRYHPPICRGSELKRECFEPKCDKIHLKFTKRTPPGTQKNAKATKKEVATKPDNRQEKKGKADPTKGRNSTNDSKTGAVDQDFLLTMMGTLRDGMMQEMLTAMDQMMRDRMDELRTSLSPQGASVLERFRQRSTPVLNSSPGSTPRRNVPSYGDILKHSQSSCCSTPVA